MRGFVVRVLVLTAGVFLTIEWARPPSRPVAVRSDAIRWERHSLWIARDADSDDYEFSANLPLPEQLNHARDQLRDIRFWLQKYYERYGGIFDEIRCWGLVTAAAASSVHVRLLSEFPVTDAWKFLARIGDTQYLCNVTACDELRLEGSVVETTLVSDRIGPDNGVLLYRPVQLRPVPRARPDAPEEELNSVLSEIGRMSAALAMYKEGLHPRPPVGLERESRVLEVRQQEDQTLIVIAAGAKHGVTVGDEWRLSRGSSFVGFVKIVRVLEAKAVGEFDTQFPGNGAPPRVGDRAYSR